MTTHSDEYYSTSFSHLPRNKSFDSTYDHLQVFWSGLHRIIGISGECSWCRARSTRPGWKTGHRRWYNRAGESREHRKSTADYQQSACPGPSKQTWPLALPTSILQRHSRCTETLQGRGKNLSTDTAFLFRQRHLARQGQASNPVLTTSHTSYYPFILPYYSSKAARVDWRHKWVSPPKSSSTRNCTMIYGTIYSHQSIQAIQVLLL